MTQKTLDDVRRIVLPVITAGFSFFAGVVIMDIKSDLKDFKKDMYEVKIALGIQEGLKGNKAEAPPIKKLEYKFPHIVAKEPEDEIELKNFFVTI
jgi:hypothetical protein